jgi:hypothetical protein
MQSRILFSMAACAARTQNPSEIERSLAGPEYSAAERSRFYERLKKGEYRLQKGLNRGEKKLENELLRLENKVGPIVREFLEWPLWAWLGEGDFGWWDLNAQEEELYYFWWRHIPAPPEPNLIDVDRYLHSLLFHTDSPDPGMLNMAVYCLKLAELNGNLAQYILTYEGLFNAYLTYDFAGQCYLEVAWLEIMAHLNRWYRLLELHKRSPESRNEVRDRCRALNDYGIHLTIERRLFDDDKLPQYVFEPKYTVPKEPFPDIHISQPTFVIREHLARQSS